MIFIQSIFLIFSVTVNLAEKITSHAYALGRFQLFCNIPTLDPLDEVAWFKDNQLFLPAVGRDITFSAKGRNITFDRIMESDAGVYSCISQRTGDQVSQEVIVNQPIYPGISLHYNTINNSKTVEPSKFI